MITTPEQMREAAAQKLTEILDGWEVIRKYHQPGSYAGDAAVATIRAIPIAPQPVAESPVETFVMRETVVDAISYERKTVEYLAVKYADYLKLSALTIHPADPLSDPRVVALVEAARKVMSASELREAYHRLPNDKNRIGAPKSPKGKARDAWLKSFRRACSATEAALRAIGGEA